MGWRLNMSEEGDKRIMELIPKANKETAVIIAGVDPDNYDKIKLKKDGLDYFIELVATVIYMSCTTLIVRNYRKQLFIRFSLARSVKGPP